MNAIKFLFAAYIATWVIHGVYLGSLVRRFGRLRQQFKEVNASGFRRSASGFPRQD
jgi:CcmD family protein